MDVIIEILLEIFGELFIDLIGGFIGGICENILFDFTFNTSKEKKNVIRIVVFTLISGLVLTLLVLCFVFGKTIFVIATAVFILVNTILNIVAKLVEKKGHIALPVTIRVVQILCQAAYVIILHINGKLIQNNAGRISLFVLSAIGFWICIAMNVYRIYRTSQKGNIEKQDK